MGELLLVAAGISAWLAIYNLMVFAVRRQRLSLWVGLWSTASLVYQVCRYLQLQPGAGPWLWLQDRTCFAMALCLIVLVPLIIQEVTGCRDFPRAVKVHAGVLFAAWLLSLVTDLFLTGGVDSYVDFDGHTVAFTRVGPLYAPLLVGGTLAALWFVVTMVRRSTVLSVREKAAWLAALGGYQLLAGNDMFLYSGITHALFPSLPGQSLFEFGVAALAVTLSLRMARRSELSQQELEAQVLERTRQLELALAEAHSAIRAKVVFLASMSHEVRTPLNGVIGLTELMLDEELPSAVRPRLELVLRSGRTLKALVDDVLDFARLDAHGVTLGRADFSPLATLKDVVALYEGNALAKGLTVTLEDDGLPALVTGDEQRLGQIVANLVNNAVKFTSRGGVRVHASAVRQGDARAQLTIAVVDTGSGITPEDQARLFKPFSQVGVSMSSPGQGGTGLGLAISRELVQLMGGTVELESEPGRGSTFTVRAELEVRTWEAPALTAALREVARRYDGRVLVAEDNPINRLVTEGLLKSLGLKPTLVVDGAQAVLAVAAGGYELIFMDCQMPELDGFEATRQLRASGYKGTIVALTAFASNDDRAQCLAAGMDDYLTKPLRKRDLDGVLARYLAV